MSQTPDSSATSQDSVQHITFVDERPETTDPLLPSVSIPATSPLTAPDVRMTAENLLQNPIQIASGDWTTTDTRGSVLATLDLPAVFVSIPSFQSYILSIYAFLKCTLVLTIKLNSTRFHQGALWAFSDPMHQMLDAPRAIRPLSDPRKYVNIYSASSQPRVELDAAQSNPACLRIPFVHIQDRLTTNSKETFDVMSRVRLLVASPLLAATGSLGTVSYQIFIHAEDVSLDDPIYPHTPLIPTNPTPALMHGAAMSAVSKTASGFSAAGANVMTGNYGKAATSASKGLEGVGEALTLFNLDKPSDPSACVINTLAPIAPLSHGTGVDASVRLGNAPLGAYLEERFANGSSQDMDLYARAQIPGLVDIMNWNTDQLPGTVLRSVPVMPSYTASEAVVDPEYPSGYAKIYNTNLSYIAEMFVYWRMSMLYMLKVYCSQFHSGRLMITFTPNQRATPPANLSEYTNLPAVYFDIQGNTLNTFVVPFHSSLTRKTWAPWATVPNRFQFTDQHILGYMDIVVFNRLVAPSNVAPSVDLLLFQAAYNDVEFESPRALASSNFTVPLLNPLTPPPVENANMHSADVIETTSRAAPAPVFLAKVPRTVTRMNVFNEGVRDARELTRRYTPMLWYSIPLVAPTPSNYVLPAIPCFFGTAQFPVRPWLRSEETVPPGTFSQIRGYRDATSFANRIARMNVFYHGGYNVKVVPITSRNSPVLLSATYIPDEGVLPLINPPDLLSVLNPSWSYSTHLTNVSQNASLQVQAPFMSGYNQVVTETVADPATFPPDVERAGSIRIVAISDRTDGLPMTTAFPPTLPNALPCVSVIVFTASADDAVYHYAVAPPVTYSNQTLVPPPV